MRLVTRVDVEGAGAGAAVDPLAVIAYGCSAEASRSSLAVAAFLTHADTR